MYCKAAMFWNCGNIGCPCKTGPLWTTSGWHQHKGGNYWLKLFFPFKVFTGSCVWHAKDADCTWVAARNWAQTIWCSVRLQRARKGHCDMERLHTSAFQTLQHLQSETLTSEEFRMALLVSLFWWQSKQLLGPPWKLWKLGQRFQG